MVARRILTSVFGIAVVMALQECDDKLAFNIVDYILTTFYAIDFMMTGIVVRFDKVIKKKWTITQAIMVLGMLFDMIFCKVRSPPSVR